MPKEKYDVLAEVIGKKTLHEDVRGLTVLAPAIAETAVPGQFVQVSVPGGECILRRPLGIANADADKGLLTLIYRLVGKGTLHLSRLQAGDKLYVMGPLGNGFSMTAKHPLLVGGGMGLSPLLFCAQRLREFEILMGWKNDEESFWMELFSSYTKEMYITTNDGSLGRKGFTVDLLPELLEANHYDSILTCGPEIMMKAVAKIAKEANIPCQVSLERRMGCGLGACLSCSIDGTDGKRYKVCKDGPVFWAEDVFSFD